MKKITVECGGIADKKALYDALAQLLEAPVWFGRNLDALHDLLDDMTAKEALAIELRDFDILRQNLGGYADALREVLDDTRADVTYL